MVRNKLSEAKLDQIACSASVGSAGASQEREGRAEEVRLDVLRTEVRRVKYLTEKNRSRALQKEFRKKNADVVGSDHAGISNLPNIAI